MRYHVYAVKLTMIRLPPQILYVGQGVRKQVYVFYFFRLYDPLSSNDGHFMAINVGLVDHTHQHNW